MLEKIQCRYLIPYNSHNRLTIIVLKKSCYTWWQKHTQKLNECSFALFFLHVSSYVIWNFEKAQRMFKCSHQSINRICKDVFLNKNTTFGMQNIDSFLFYVAAKFECTNFRVVDIAIKSEYLFIPPHWLHQKFVEKSYLNIWFKRMKFLQYCGIWPFILFSNNSQSFRYE